MLIFCKSPLGWCSDETELLISIWADDQPEKVTPCGGFLFNLINEISVALSECKNKAPPDTEVNLGSTSSSLHFNEP